jgi:hypothetical protein
MTVEAPQSTLNTINFVTQCLCIPIITIFVALRFAVRIYFNQFILVEDGTYIILPTDIYGIVLTIIQLSVYSHGQVNCLLAPNIH